MKVFLTGATGFIGGHILRALSERAIRVSCLVRPGRGAALEAEQLPGVRLVEGQFTNPDSWSADVEGHDVVVNAVGIIRESKRATFAAVHTDSPMALFRAAKSAGIRKIIQISALGTEDDANSGYFRSKRRADVALENLGVPYVILKPSIVYGPGDASTTFFTSLAALPVTMVPGDGTYLVQPIHIDDLIRAVVLSLPLPNDTADTANTGEIGDTANNQDAPARSEIANVNVDAGGAEPMTFDDMLDVLARWVRGRQGGRGARKVHVPKRVMGWVAAVTDRLGGRGPITTDELAMLFAGNACDNTRFISTFGFEPRPYGIGIARRPRTQAALWHARLTHVRIPLRITVALIWLITAFVSLFLAPDQGRAYLANVGLTGALGELALYGSCAFEAVIGTATLIGYRVRLMGAIQIAMVLFFTLLLSVSEPELWAHPFGPLSKNIPILGATLAMIAIEDG